jgi:NifU-like protein involved in Fe-S cluster formation
MNPQNVGRMEKPDGRGCTTSRNVEDFIEICIQVSGAPERLEGIRFRAVGNPALMACGSMLTVLLQGMLIEDAVSVPPEALERALGGLPASKRYCAELVFVALRAAVEDLAQRRALQREPQRPSTLTPPTVL